MVGGVEDLVKGLSAAFKGMPDIFSSNVQANLRLGTTYYVNSEGSSFTRRSPAVSVRALAGTQAVDGTELEDFVAAYGRRWEDLPDREELADRFGVWPSAWFNAAMRNSSTATTGRCC